MILNNFVLYIRMITPSMIPLECFITCCCWFHLNVCKQLEIQINKGVMLWKLNCITIWYSNKFSNHTAWLDNFFPSCVIYFDRISFLTDQIRASACLILEVFQGMTMLRLSPTLLSKLISLLFIRICNSVWKTINRASW